MTKDRSFPTSSPEFYAYLAGVIDSDGAIGIVRRNEPANSHGYTYREIVQLTWKKTPETEEFVSLLKQLYGGSTGEYQSGGFEAGCLTVRYSADGKGAERIALDIIPYLRLKKHRAQLLIDMRKLKNIKYGNGHRKPDSVWEAEDIIYEKALLQRRTP